MSQNTPKQNKEEEKVDEHFVTPQNTPEKQKASVKIEPQSTPIKDQKRKSWSLFGFLSNLAGGSQQNEEEDDEAKPAKEAKKEAKEPSPQKPPPVPSKRVQTLSPNPLTPKKETNIPLKKGQRTSSLAHIIPPLDEPSDDSISMDQEFDALPEDSSGSTGESDSEPLDDLNDMWAK